METARKNGEWEIVANQKDDELTKLRGEVEKEKLEALRQKVGNRHRLPENQIKRLIGTTEAELEKDAAEVAKDVVPPSPGNRPGFTGQ